VALRLFTEHPASVGETYIEHFGRATGFGLRMVLCGIACLIHGLLPFLFVRTGSRGITTLYEQMVTHRDRRTVADPGAARPAAVATHDLGVLS
jgi:hypothetical protein